MDDYEWRNKGRGGSGLDIYGGRGESVIHYILGEEEIREEIGYLKIRDRIESDHPSLVAWMRIEREGGMEKKGG